jgi:hypothetical protein
MDKHTSYIIYRRNGEILGTTRYKIDAFAIACRWHGAYVTDREGHKMNEDE